jgi:hypothetical protein
MPSTQIDRIDGISTSEAVKTACRAGSLGNLTLSGLQTVDGVALAANDRVLVKNQSNAVENGIYTAQTTAWQREPDFDGERDATTGTLVFIFAGGQAATWWAVTTLMPFVIAQDPIEFEQTTLAFTVVPASETAAGVAEIATQTETNTGTDDTRIVSPLKLAVNLTQALADDVPAAVTSTGSANAYVVTYSPAISALRAGQVYPWIASFANTGAATVNINGKGAKSIKTVFGANPSSGYIISGQPMLTLYDGANMLLVSAPSTSVTTPPLFITGLLPTAINGTSTTGAVTISAGSCTDSTGASSITSAGHSWAVSNGNAANGYQGGTTLPNSSTIHLFEIWGSSGETSFASTSLTPTLPSGYTFYRYNFSILTDSSGNPLGGTAIEVAGGGYKFLFAATQFIFSGAAPTTGTLISVPVPGGLKCDVIINAGMAVTTAAAQSVLVSSPDSPDDAAVALSSGNLMAGSASAIGTSAAQLTITTNTSSQVRHRASAATQSTSYKGVGFIDWRRI